MQILPDYAAQLSAICPEFVQDAPRFEQRNNDNKCRISGTRYQGGEDLIMALTTKYPALSRLQAAQMVELLTQNMEAIEQERLARLQQEYTSPAEWVANWMNASNVKVSLSGQLTGTGGSDVENRLMIAANEYNTTVPKELRLPEDKKLVRYLQAWAEDKRIALRDELRAHIKYTGRTWAEVMAQATVLATAYRAKVRVGAHVPPVEADALMLVHFMHSVKRKIFGLDAKNHVALIWYGCQGCGKSQAAEILARSIAHGDYQTFRSVDGRSLTDTRERKINSSMPFLIADEMDKFDTNLNALKRIITEGKVTSVRELYRTAETELENIFSVCCTTNEDIREILGEASGMRRYWQIHGPWQVREKMDWDVITNFYYLPLWRSIDENHPGVFYLPEYKDLLDVCFKAQDSYRKDGAIPLYLRDAKLTPAPKYKRKNLKKIHPTEVYKDYRRYCRDMGHRAKSKDSFLVSLEIKVYLGENENQFVCPPNWYPGLWKDPESPTETNDDVSLDDLTLELEDLLI
jgi:hypothetical protein